MKGNWQLVVNRKSCIHLLLDCQIYTVSLENPAHLGPFSLCHYSGVGWSDVGHPKTLERCVGCDRQNSAVTGVKTCLGIHLSRRPMEMWTF